MASEANDLSGHVVIVTFSGSVTAMTRGAR